MCEGVANREKGEIAIAVGDKEYVLVLDFEAMCQLEERLSTDAGKDVTFIEVMAKAERGSMRHMRAVFWAALLRHQPDMTFQDASALVMELGGVQGLNDTLLSVAQASQPTKAETKGSKRPQRAQVNGAETSGTGGRSTSRPDARA